jgi:hypothetical protein
LCLIQLILLGRTTNERESDYNKLRHSLFHWIVEILQTLNLKELAIFTNCLIPFECNSDISKKPSLVPQHFGTI